MIIFDFEVVGRSGEQVGRYGECGVEWRLGRTVDRRTLTSRSDGDDMMGVLRCLYGAHRGRG